jgi:hypothetical protein
MKRLFIIGFLISISTLSIGHFSRTTGSFSAQICYKGHSDEAFSGNLNFNGSPIGYIIAINRTSKRIKAKYFAYKENGKVVHERYDSWRTGKNVVLVSSGAYATGFSGSDIPVGLTVDNGNIVNKNIDPTMDGLVIVEAVGGVRMTNIKDGDLTIRKGTVDRKVNVNDPLQRSEFLSWCESEDATVFQTHLLIYKNQLKLSYLNSSGKVAERKMIVLAYDSSGNLYHFIVYSKFKQMTLYEMASNTLIMLNENGYNVVAAANLDTGGVDVLSTSTELADCGGQSIEGLTNARRREMTNMLAYFYE